MDDSIKIIQISDLHLFKGPHARHLGLDTEKTLQQILELINNNESNFELLLVTGDLSQDGSPASYRRIADYFKSYNWPIAWLPGNHDDKVVLKDVFMQEKMPSNNCIQLRDWQIVLLDSTVPNEIPGYLAEQELNFLQHCLDANKTNTIVCLHHHPIPVESKIADQYMLTNANQFWEKIDQYPHVELVLCGHVHQSYEAIVNEVSVLTCPATCAQLLPHAETLMFDTVGPGYRWITLFPDGYYETGVRRIENFEASKEYQVNQEAAVE